MTWHNNSDETVTFVPKISFDDPDRRVSGETGTWHDMTGVTLAGGETARSLFDFDTSSQGMYALVNVNVNYSNHEVLICDRIELMSGEADTEPPSVPEGLSAEIMPGPQVRLTWNPSSDNVATAGYRIYNGDGTEIGTAPDAVYVIYDVTPGTYAYTVTAYDVPGNGSAHSDPLTVTVGSGYVLLLANFGGDESGNRFGIAGWDTVIKDCYTNYRDIGPGGTTVTAGSNGSYDHQGVTGPARAFAPGDRIAVTWHNNSDETVTFVPKISFDDPDRRVMGETGTWHDMTGVTLAGGETARSLFDFDTSSQGTYALVNVNVNYPNHEMLICDKIELMIPGQGTDTQPPTVPQNLTAVETPVISGCRTSLSWDPSSDNTGVDHYEIFRDGGKLPEDVTGTAYDDSDGLAPQTTYIYTVRACDAAGNCSAQSDPASVTTGGNTAPSLTITEPDGTDDTAGDSYIISWNDDDPDDDAQISLYYDTDSSGADGTLIAGGLGEDADGTGDEYEWDTSALSPGDYYVYGVISDSVNDPVTAYGTGPVTVTGTVPAPEIVTFTANPETITAGETSVLTWEVSNADTVTIDQGIGSAGLNGSVTLQPSETTTYTLTAENSGGTVTAQVTITVSSSSDPVNIFASAPEIQKGSSFTLSWTFVKDRKAHILTTVWARSRKTDLR